MLKRLSQAEIEIIQANKAALLNAQKIVSIPWQMLAAVWYRERNLQMGNNPFQFDPPPSHALIMGLLQSYTEYKPLRYSIDDFDFAAILAACWLRHKCRFNLVSIQSFEIENGKTETFTKLDTSDEAVADAFYGYNGRAYGDNPLNSPYVANELDDLHHDMHFRGTVDGKWVDVVDQRPGAFTVYKQLLEENI